MDNTDNDGNEIKGQVVSIDAGSPVNSAAFGCGTPENQLTEQPQRDYWKRFDFSKEFVLATGHVNGRVRIWDVYTGEHLPVIISHCLNSSPISQVLAAGYPPEIRFSNSVFFP